MKRTLFALWALLAGGCETDYVNHPVTGQKALDAYYKGQRQIPSIFSDPQMDQPAPWVQPVPQEQPHTGFAFGPNGQSAIIQQTPNGANVFGSDGSTTIIQY